MVPLSQIEFGGIIHYSGRNISCLEAGHIKQLCYVALKQICAFFGVSSTDEISVKNNLSLLNQDKIKDIRHKYNKLVKVTEGEFKYLSPIECPSCKKLSLIQTYKTIFDKQFTFYHCTNIHCRKDFACEIIENDETIRFKDKLPPKCTNCSCYFFIKSYRRFHFGGSKMYQYYFCGNCGKRHRQLLSPSLETQIEVNSDRASEGQVKAEEVALTSEVSITSVRN